MAEPRVTETERSASDRKVDRSPDEIRSATIVELALDAIVSIDHEGRVVEFNPAAERMFGYSRDEIMGQPMADRIIPAHLRTAHYAGLKHHLATGEARVLGRRLELEAMRADGSLFPVELVIVRIPLDGPPVFTSYIRDLTTHRKAVADLEAQASELAKSRDEANEANQAKSEFLAAMSHELRTPLNAILGYTALLTEGVHGSITTEQSDRLARIKRSGQHLLALINNILNFARIEAGHVEFDVRAVPVPEVLKATEEILAPQMAAKNLRYQVRNTCGDTGVHADREKLLQILINLLTNAVRHTCEGGQIEVSCRREADVVLISVRDTGPGIPSNKLEAIFEPFVQVEGVYQGERLGVGLGLSISRELGRAMHGDVTVESEPGVGSTFTVQLPAARLQQPRPPDSRSIA